MGMPARKKRKSDLSVSDLLKSQDGETCIFCLSSEDNEEEYGKFIKKCGLQVHYFCMLFASGLCQRGKSEEVGIYGFLPEDIIKEIKRGSRLRCYCCKKKGSTIGCVVGSCRKMFHLGCGRQNGTLHQFFGSFRSFCQEHRPRQMVPTSDRLSFYGTANTPCAICMNSLEARASNETLRSPCCRNSWFHRSCIQKHASTAGLYFFKCPLCNNKEQFQNEMLEFGIYIPDQDAAWETEPNAFNELLERYLNCDAPTCKCPNGRKYNKDGGKWEITTCDWCGSKGTHDACNSLLKVGRNLVCEECKEIDDRSKQQRSAQKRKKTPLKKTRTSLDEKLAIDLEEKGKSEYPGPSSAIVKTKPTTIKTPESNRGRSAGMVLRLSYEETDDDVDVVEDDPVYLSPLSSASKDRLSRDIPAALGSGEQSGSRRGRSRHRRRSRSSSSEYIPLSKVRGRLRSQSRRRSISARSNSSSSTDSRVQFNISGSTGRSASPSPVAHKRKRSRSSSESPLRKRLRSASRGRQRHSSSEHCIRKRLRSASRGRLHQSVKDSGLCSPLRDSNRSSSSLDSPKCLRKKTISHESLLSKHSPLCNNNSSKKKSTYNTKKSLDYDEVDGDVTISKKALRKKKKMLKKRKNPFDAENCKGVKAVYKKKHKKMLISMEPEFSDLPPVAQHDVQIINDSDSENCIKKSKTIEERPKVDSNPQISKSGDTAEKKSALQDIFDKNRKPIEGVNKLGIGNKYRRKTNSVSPQKGSNEKQKRSYRKKNQVDSKQRLLNQWFTSSKECNKENKYLTIKWHGMEYIKVIVSPRNKKTPLTSDLSAENVSLKSQEKWKSSPNNKINQLKQSPTKRSPKTPACSVNPRLPNGPSPRVTRSGSSPSLALLSPKTCTAEEIIEKLSGRKSTPSSLRSSPRLDKEKARCSLNSKFVDTGLIQANYPILTTFLKEHGILDNKTDNLEDDYMDEDFLTSEEEESSDNVKSDLPYVIKPYKDISGLEQVQVVLPSN